MKLIVQQEGFFRSENSVEIPEEEIEKTEHMGGDTY